MGYHRLSITTPGSFFIYFADFLQIISLISVGVFPDFLGASTSGATPACRSVNIAMGGPHRRFLIASVSLMTFLGHNGQYISGSGFSILCFINSIPFINKQLSKNCLEKRLLFCWLHFTASYKLARRGKSCCRTDFLVLVLGLCPEHIKSSDHEATALAEARMGHLGA